MSKNILLEGLPGVGKTTLIKKIIDKLAKLTADLTGFYTEEVRDQKNNRMGFDVVTLKNERAILARKSSKGDVSSKYKVGSYDVYLDEFEKVALPVLSDVKKIIVIDEIGKMELTSKRFQSLVEKIITDPQVRVIATVPLKGGGPIVERIKNNPLNNVYRVTPQNRENLFDSIASVVSMDSFFG